VSIAATDATLIVVSSWLALIILNEGSFPPFVRASVAAVILAGASIPLFAVFGLYRNVTRYLGAPAILQLAALAGASSAIALGLTSLVFRHSLPVMFFAVYGLLAFVLLTSVRMAAKLILSGQLALASKGRPAAIYGAGATGQQLLALIETSPEFRPVLFLDDDTDLIGRKVAGLPVIGTSAGILETELDRREISAVFLGIPSLRRDIRKRLLERLAHLPLRIWSTPPFSVLSSTSEWPVKGLPELEIEDLLHRDPVPVATDSEHPFVTGRSVFVSGAAGTIGSQLCREILRLRPARLVAYDHSEVGLVSLARSLGGVTGREGTGTDAEVIFKLGSVTDLPHLDATLRRHEIETAFHAAAYKHVPVVEDNAIASISNNVFGTLNLATAALEAGVGHCVLVSTDKAVRPTGTMGATKRVAELVFQAYSGLDSQTRFSIVRFGNVLGSSGSVVPLFREQIAAGGPVTVTHPEVTRYFMTTPEAGELVLRAARMARGGEIFVLDMGVPVRVQDLARQMIHLSGRRLWDGDADADEADIEIVFTGLRPGEKLHEELLISGTDLPTEHPRIRCAVEEGLELPDLSKRLDELSASVFAHDESQAREILFSLVGGFEQHAGAFGNAKTRPHTAANGLAGGGSP
jgi:FlaA1/EpsC-like NDP-sugar epimerase